MLRRDLHSDENFWPCVSDMFLALFVIALVLYSTASVDKGKGDLYISEYTVEEACQLLEHVQKKFPDSNQVQAINIAVLSQEKDSMHPKLGRALCKLTEIPETKYLFYLSHATEVDYPRQNEGEFSYKDAVRFLYKVSFEDKRSMAEDDARYDKAMRAVRENLFIRLEAKGSYYERMTPEELINEIEQLQKLLSSSVEKEKYDALKSELERMKSVLQSRPDGEELQRLQLLIGSLQMQLDEARKSEGNARKIATSLKVEIEKIKNRLDTRVHVMDEVDKILQKDKYAAFHSKGVEIDKAQGVIRMSHHFIGFNPGGFRMREGLSIDSEKVFLSKLSTGSKKNLELLASFLNEVGKAVKDDSLPVDNISIECHADQETHDKKGRPVPPYYNEGLSLKRAFGVWRFLDIETNKLLSSYKNRAGLGLFSLSGFGSRVPLIRESGESQSQYNDRCRRIEIRFNCSPLHVQEQMQESEPDSNMKG